MHSNSLSNSSSWQLAEWFPIDSDTNEDHTALCPKTVWPVWTTVLALMDPIPVRITLQKRTELDHIIQMPGI